MGMKKWVVNSLSSVLDFMMWFTVIGMAIGGALLGSNLNNGVAAVGLFFLGALVGYIFNVIRLVRQPVKSMI